MKNLDLLVPTVEQHESGWYWATVSGINPLRVRLDGDDTPLGITPDSLVKDLVVGNRVWTQIEGRRVIVHGASASQGAVSAIPVGTIQMYGANPASPPEGWLYCRGGTFQSTQYPALAALLGDTYGTRSGTTFYLPDFNARSPVGVGGPAVPAVGGNNYSVGQKWGDERMQLHNHGISDPGHAHSVYDPGHNHAAPVAVYDGGSASSYRSLFATNAPFWSMGDWNNPVTREATGISLYANTTGISVTNSGSGDKGNVHPVLGMNFIIKT